jgi:predicted regulator of Ras-like GTPase activity (Roadblock/LC7/MglB family)
MQGYSVSVEQSERLNTIISDLSVQAEADAVFLTDYSGNILASIEQDSNRNADNVAALAAGSFSATRELASLIGEPSFYSIYHKGQHASIYMQSVTTDILVFVVFGKGTTVGLVKLYVDKANRELEPILEEMLGQTIADAGGKAQEFEIDTSQLFQGSKGPEGTSAASC